MGQKVHPIGYRLGINKGWNSNWFATKDYPALLHEDIEIKRYIKRYIKKDKNLSNAGISKIVIERASSKITINIYTGKPGIIIGRKGVEVDNLKAILSKKLKGRQVFLNVVDVRNPEIDAQLVSENVAMQLEQRVAFRKAIKRTISVALRFGVGGIKIQCAGRLGGAEIARTEWYREGRVPLHTLRANIDYGVSEANTTFGIIGVKVWIFHGEILNKSYKKTVTDGRFKRD